MQKNTHTLNDMPIWKALLQLSIPIILANILQVAYQFTDSFWVGKLGAWAIASTTLAGTILFLTISLGSWFAMAGSILIAQYFGAKNKKMVNHIAAQSILMIIVISLLLSVLGYIFSPNLIQMMWVDPSIFETTLGFLRISFIGIVFNFSFFMFQAIMRWIWKANLPIYIVLGTVTLNFFLDPVLIYGYSIIPAFWVAWAAMATLLTQSIASIIGFSILFRWKYGIHTQLRDYIPDFAIIKKSFFLWLPSSIEMTARSGSFAIMIWIVATFWTVALAAYWVAGNAMQLTVILAMWLSMATSVLVGQSVWAGMIERAKKITTRSSIISFFLMTIIGGILFLFAPYCIQFFIPRDQQVIDIWANVIRISALFFWLIGIQMSISGVMRAIWKTQIPMILTLLGQWVLKIPLAYFLSKYTALWLSGIWWSEPISSFVVSIVLLIILSKVDWSKSNLTKQHTLEKDVMEETLIETGVKADY